MTIGTKLCTTDIHFHVTQVTYGKGLLINMQKLVLGAYLPDFTSQKNENWQNCTTSGA